MRLIEFDDPDGDPDDEDYGSPEVQELEGLAYRYVQIVPEKCVELFDKAIERGIDHPVVFLCDVADPVGISIAQKFTSQKQIQTAVEKTPAKEGKRPGICFWYDLESLASREPSLYGAIRARMVNLVIGYFPVVVVAQGGYNAFPWPITLKEKSKFHLLPG